ncbi:MAG: protein kinase domain-containing protein, partial [Bythopirellula sp.]
MNPSPAEPELDATEATSPTSTPAGAPLRFTYPSGSRPLEGYQIKRGVGRGGFGEVYFAVSDAGKEVALKLIRRNLDVELRGVTQCLNLKHQNLVALYDIRNDEHDDRWVVMEYVSGESLEDVVDRHPQGMPIELAMQWFS